MTIDALTGEKQKCFVNADGFRLCNFVVKQGIARWTKSGKWWKFPALPFRRKPKANEVKGETATPLKEVAVSQTNKM